MLAGEGQADLFFERVEADTHHCVVLRWDTGRQCYDFASAHVWTDAELKRARRPDSLGGKRGAPVRGQKKAPMKKSIGACSAVAVLELSGSGAVAGDPGDAHAGGRSRREPTIHVVGVS